MDPTLRIEGEFTIFRAAELKPLLLADPPPTVVDLSAVTDIDTAGVQLLWAAQRAAQAAGSGLRLRNPSEAVQAVLQLLQLQERLPCEDRAPVATGTTS